MKAIYFFLQEGVEQEGGWKEIMCYKQTYLPFRGVGLHILTI